MKPQTWAYVFLLSISITGLANAIPEEKTPMFKVGAATATVNPPKGICLAGYDCGRKSAGIHDDLFVKAVAFHDGENTIVLVVIDSISLQYDTVCAIRNTAAKTITTLPPEHILVQATHTHCAPDTIGIYGPDETHPGRDAAYMTQLTNTAAQQIARAISTLKPAHLVFAETACNGWVANDSEPGVLDTSVTILQCLDHDGTSIATLTNFACHPTVLDGNTTLTSADWVGAFYRHMANIPGKHLFLQGAIGCWIQPVTPERSFALAEQYGADLATKVQAALKHTTPLQDTHIRFAHKVYPMPITNPKFQKMSTMGLMPRPLTDTTETEAAWFAIGPAQFATHPGETAPLYSNQTKALMKTGPKFVLGLGLDHLGYICPISYFGETTAKHADYLTKMSPGPKTGEYMMQALKEIIPDR